MISDQILFFAALHVLKNVWMIKVTVLGLANITTEEDHEVAEHTRQLEVWF